MASEYLQLLFLDMQKEKPKNPQKLKILNGPSRCIEKSRVQPIHYDCLIGLPLPVHKQQDEYAYKSSRPEETKQDSKVGVEMPSYLC